MTDEPVSDEPQASPSSVLALGDGPAVGVPVPRPPTSALDFLERVLSDSAKTDNAKELMASAARAASRLLVSVGLVACGIAAVATLLTRYAGFGVVSGGAIATVATGGVLGTTWLTRTIRRRRIARRGSRTPA
jgi:hypothetical protein